MFNYDGLSKKPLIFRSFSGLEVAEFDALYSKIKEAHAAFEQKRLYRSDRKRKLGAGHPFKLPLNERLLMLLIYYRLYVTSTLLAFLFDLGQTNVLKDIRLLEPLVSEVLPLPERPTIATNSPDCILRSTPSKALIEGQFFRKYSLVKLHVSNNGLHCIVMLFTSKMSKGFGRLQFCGTPSWKYSCKYSAA